MLQFPNEQAEPVRVRIKNNIFLIEQTSVFSLSKFFIFINFQSNPLCCKLVMASCRYAVSMMCITRVLLKISAILVLTSLY